MILDLEKLWEPYSGDGCSLETHVNWCLAECKKRGVDDKIAQAAVQLVFLEMQNGRVFTKGICPCGCEGLNIHTAANHYTIRVAEAMDGERRTETARILAGTLNAAILKHIEADNARYLAEMMPQTPDEPKTQPGAIKRTWNKLWSPYR